jgi:hypothetical protein
LWAGLEGVDRRLLLSEIVEAGLAVARPVLDEAIAKKRADG